MCQRMLIVMCVLRRVVRFHKEPSSFVFLYVRIYLPTSKNITLSLSA